MARYPNLLLLFCLLGFSLALKGYSNAGPFESGPVIVELNFNRAALAQAAIPADFATQSPHIWPQAIQFGINPLFFLKGPVSIALGYERFSVPRLNASSIDSAVNDFEFDLQAQGGYAKIYLSPHRLWDFYGQWSIQSSRLNLLWADRASMELQTGFNGWALGIDFNLGRLYDVYDPSLRFFNIFKLGFQLRQNLAGFQDLEDPSGLAENKVKWIHFKIPSLMLTAGFFIKARRKVANKTKRALKPKSTQTPRNALKRPAPSNAPPKKTTPPSSHGRKKGKLFLPFYSTHASMASIFQLQSELDIDVTPFKKIILKPGIAHLGEINSEMTLAALKKGTQVELFLERKTLGDSLVQILSGIDSKGVKAVIPRNKFKRERDETGVYVSFQIKNFEELWRTWAFQDTLPNLAPLDYLIQYLGEAFFAPDFLNQFQFFTLPPLQTVKMQPAFSLTPVQKKHFLPFRHGVLAWNQKTDLILKSIQKGAWREAKTRMLELEQSHCDYGLFYYVRGRVLFKEGQWAPAEASFSRAIKRIQSGFPDSPFKGQIYWYLGQTEIALSKFESASKHLILGVESDSSISIDSVLGLAQGFLNQGSHETVVALLKPFLLDSTMGPAPAKKVLELVLGAYKKGRNCTDFQREIKVLDQKYKSVPDSLMAFYETCAVKKVRSKWHGIASVFKIKGSGVQKDILEKASNEFRERLKGFKSFTVYGNEVMYRELEKFKIPQTGCSNVPCLKKINRLTSADWVVQGAISRGKNEVTAEVFFSHTQDQNKNVQAKQTVSKKSPEPEQLALRLALWKILDIPILKSISLKASGKIRRPEAQLRQLGLAVVLFSKKTAKDNGIRFRGQKGVIIEACNSEGAASFAGLQKNDLIITVDNKPVPDIQTFYRSILSLKKGSKTAFEFYRFGSKTKAEIVIE